MHSEETEQIHHHHGHHGHAHSHANRISSLNGVYILSIALNMGFVIIEAGMGFWSDSLGLLSDAGHNLSDVFSLVLAMIAFKLSMSHSTKRFTYGYKKSSILISLLNAIILLIAVGAIVMESIHKIKNMDSLTVDGNAISWTAGVGILINGFTAWLLMKKQSHDINTKGAYLHMLADTLVSVGVVVSGLLISLTGWYVIDPIISLAIAGVILASTWNLLSESLRMSIDAVPEDIDVDEILHIISSTSADVESVHHLHIWPISTTEIALTAHVVMKDTARMHEVIAKIKHELGEHGISHSTLEVETTECQCQEHDCCR